MTTELWNFVHFYPGQCKPSDIHAFDTDWPSLERLNQLQMSDLKRHGSLDAAIWWALENGADVHKLMAFELPISAARFGDVMATSTNFANLDGLYASHLLLRPNRLLAMSQPGQEIPEIVAKLVRYGANLNAFATNGFMGTQYFRRQPIHLILDAYKTKEYPREDLERVHMILLRALVQNGAFDTEYVLGEREVGSFNESFPYCGTAFAMWGCAMNWISWGAICDESWRYAQHSKRNG
jgi:hypothetical protein